MADLRAEAESLGAFLAKLEERAAHRARLAIDDTLTSSEETMQRVYQAFMDNAALATVAEAPLEDETLPASRESPKKPHSRPPRCAQSAAKKPPVTLSRDVQDILRRHRELQIKRSAIMTHPNVRKWLRSLWQCQIKSKDDPTMSKQQYTHLYSQLLSGLTTEWIDSLASIIIHDAWESDSHGQPALTIEYFSDAMFFFVEHWVEEPDLAAYVAQLKCFYDLLTDKPDAMPATTRLPTLSAYHAKLQRQNEASDMGIALGKSITFDPVLYLQHPNGAPTSPTRALDNDDGASLAYPHCPIKSRSQIQIKVETTRPNRGAKMLPHL
ncbi:hypothetical protein SPRG_00220 [Saprolegnia parasitica CBS 223.65]|uniref:Uncharacterized protein n=1 Tax=Saprolegnia parasitica (strain CBS 223.65) TaxID=695850 RepID=A0A067D9N3_SAPPC|nr:hypothetical protein SPRG_00220 [Saprolegnia parasitica CBS 223.65]KDO35371.1 hypothetical protein SPRG_00220 [Saprolegnia parasitica CBS 223.65]|eukprot:XP_012193716.1 hypothetical protein SPRG_00220 [Saprolegnia parasitica CBS 223.65]